MDPSFVNLMRDLDSSPRCSLGQERVLISKYLCVTRLDKERREVGQVGDTGCHVGMGDVRVVVGCEIEVNRIHDLVLSCSDEVVEVLFHVVSTRTKEKRKGRTEFESQDPREAVRSVQGERRIAPPSLGMARSRR